MTDPGNVVPFLTRSLSDAPKADDEQSRHNYSIVHRNRRYSGDQLIGCLPVKCVQEMNLMGPCTLQALWDEVARRWPKLADEIVDVVGGLD